jgi:hypothetical protein
LAQTVNCATMIQVGFSDVPMCGTGPLSQGAALQQCPAFRRFYLQ